ncbi:MAG: hypothetical protein KGJ86_17045, partial [Chloroflexota bacterium]|nr:hypothetical protein [Chloroflexota bacterium]
MTGWQRAFAARRRTADQALEEHLRPGQTVFIVADLAEPATLVSALLPKLPRMAPLSIIAQFVGGQAPYAADEYSAWVRLLALMPNRQVAARTDSGGVQYLPCHSSQIPRLFRDG